MKIFTLSRLTRLGPAQKLAGILAGLLLLFSLTIGPSPTFAQGSCSCEEWQGPVRLICIPVDTCDTGYIPSEDSCPTEFADPYGCKVGATCTCVSGSAAPCTEAGGYCMVSCGIDYEHYQPGDPECVASGMMCCKPADENGDDENGNGGPICTCTTADGGCGIQTAIGCIPTDLYAFGGFILERGIYLGILVTILLIIISGYGIISSTGDPERLAEAKSRLTAAIAGLLFLLFSVIILRIIACNIIGGEAKEFFCP